MRTGSLCEQLSFAVSLSAGSLYVYCLAISLVPCLSFVAALSVPAVAAASWAEGFFCCFWFLSSSSEPQRRDQVPRAKFIAVSCEQEAVSERFSAHVHPARCFLADFEFVAQDCLPGGFDGFLALYCHSAEVGHVISQEPVHVVSEHTWLVPGCPSLVGISRTDHLPVDCQETVLVAELLSSRRHLTSHPGSSHLNHCLAALLDHLRLRHVFSLLCFFRLGRDLGE